MSIFEKIKNSFAKYKKNKEIERNMKELNKIIEDESKNVITLVKYNNFDPQEQELKNKIIFAKLTDEIINPPKNIKKKSKKSPKNFNKK